MEQVEQVSIMGQNEILQQMTGHALAEAAGILSTISHTETRLSVVSMGTIGMEEAPALFDETEPQMIAVSQRLEGIIKGHAIFMLNDDRSLILIRELLNEHAQLRELTEMEEEALAEVGNIIINRCLSNYTEILKGRVSCQLPLLTRGHYAQLLQEFSDDIADDELFYIHLSIQTTLQAYSAYLLWTRLSWNDQASSASLVNKPAD